MKTREAFYKPGIEPPEKTIENLPQVPRELHPTAIRYSLLWRILTFIAISALTGLIIHQAFLSYVQNGSLSSWFILIAIIPVWLGFIPWWLISTYRRRMRSFEYCKRIYQNGIPAVGTITVLTRSSNHNQDFRFLEQKKFSSLARVRVDFTFPVGDVLKTGTANIREQNMAYLRMNSDICVLYLPDDPSQNLLFPIPGSEFFTYLTH